MLHPLIVPDRVHKSGSVDGVRRSYKTDDNGSAIVRHSAIWFAERKNEKPHFPVAPTRGGSGASAADAIIIDSDEDRGGAPPLSRTDKPRGLSISCGTSLNKDVVNHSDSDIEPLSSVHSENKIEEDSEDSDLSPAPLRAGPSGPTPSSPPPRRDSMGKNIATLSGFCSDSSDVATSETDEAGKEINAAENVDGSRTSTPHSKLPSLGPVRRLLAKGRQRGGPGRDASLGRPRVSPGLSKKQTRRESLEKAFAITSSDSEEELDCPASDPELKRIPLPKTDHGRPRRLLMPESDDLPLVAVSMRGDCHFIERKKKWVLN